MLQAGTKLKNIDVLKIKANGSITSGIISEIPEPENKTEGKKVIRNNKEIWVDEEINNSIINITEFYNDVINLKIGYIDFDLIINFDENNKHEQIIRSEELSRKSYNRCLYICR